MKRTHPFAILVACVVFSLLGACAQLGLSTPQTFDQKIYAAADTVKQIQVSATTLVRAGKISADDATTVLTATDAATAGIQVARGYAVTNAAQADTKLKAVLAALTLTQTYLAAQQAAGK